MVIAFVNKVEQLISREPFCTEHVVVSAKRASMGHSAATGNGRGTGKRSIDATSTQTVAHTETFVH